MKVSASVAALAAIEVPLIWACVNGKVHGSVPTSLAVGLAAFLLAYKMNPAYWLRGLTWTCLTAAIVNFSVWAVDVRFDMPWFQGTVSTGGNLIAGIALLIAAGFLAWLERSGSLSKAAPGSTTSVVKLSSKSGDAIQGSKVTADGDAAGHDLAKAGRDVFQNSPVTIINEAPRTISENAPTKPTKIVPHQLRPPTANFVGRDDEFFELMARLKTGRVAICGLKGMGGVGKTELALKIAAMLAPGCVDGDIYIDLRGVDSAHRAPVTVAEAMRHVIHAFHPTEQAPDQESELEGRYRTVLNGKKVVLLLDNARDAAQVKPLLPAVPGIAIITSRQRIELEGMTPVELPPLPTDKARELLLKLCERIGNDADEIAQLCGCLPLALDLAAAAINARTDLTPAQYIERLRDKNRRLGQLDAYAKDAALRSLDASLTLSEELLDESLRPLFHALAVFPTDFDAAGAAAVWDSKEDNAQDRLYKLRSYSLVEFDEAIKRYRLHDLVRVFAEERLATDKQAQDTAARRHAVHYKEVMARAHELYLQHGEDTFKGLALFDREWTNIHAGFGWCSTRPSADKDALRLCNLYPDAGVHCLRLRQPPAERIDWLTRAMTAAEALGEQAALAMHTGNLGLIHRARGDLDEAERILRKGLEIDKKLGRLEGMASEYGNLGLIYMDRGDLDEAERMYRKSLEINEKFGRLEDMATVYGNLGLIYMDRGDLDEAERMLRKALEIEEKLGRREVMANAYGNLGLIEAQRGQIDAARELWTKARDLYARIGIPHMVEKHQKWLDSLPK